jgi:Na+/H+ antiporter NhaC
MKPQSFGIRPLLILVVPFVFVVVVWIISYSYFRHPFNNGQPLEDRLATHAAVGEAMAITSVLFSGLGFVALIATVWLQRRQIEAAIQGMEESTKAQQENLETLRAQVRIR